MKPIVLSLDCPNIRAVLNDIMLTQRWEVLRRSTRPLSVHELAEACGVSDSVAQHSLDTLVDAGLAVRLKATARRRTISYAVIAERVIVEWDAESEVHLRFLLEHRRGLRAYSRSVLERNDTFESRGMPGLPKFRGHQSFTFTRAEAETITKTLRNAWEIITQIEVQARARAAERSDARRNAREPQAPDTVEIPYHVALEFRPLGTPELPISDIGTWEKKAVARELAYISSTPATVLTTRESEIATRLAAGESRPAVAAALGVSPNTVASSTKRIYAKLGVRSRAEFVSRMKGG